MRIALENAAGQGTCSGNRIEHLAAISRRVTQAVGRAGRRPARSMVFYLPPRPYLRPDIDAIGSATFGRSWYFLD